MRASQTFDDIGLELLAGFLSRDEVRSLAAALQVHQLKPLSGGIRHIERETLERHCPLNRGSGAEAEDHRRKSYQKSFRWTAFGSTGYMANSGKSK